ncbi:MAG TPA: hypothetical protein VFV96_00715 [Verrucomicrobiae bacterium]|nr:hypothetical protein [Verrucomicrobiae bacterium]
MNPATDMPKSEMLRRSMRCFMLGWCSLVPVVGLVPALLAFADFRAVVLGKGRRWNAARTQLLVGAWLAAGGLLLSLLFGTIMAIGILQAIAAG